MRPLTDKDLADHAKHTLFNAWIDANKDIKEYSASARQLDGHRVPDQVWNREEHGGSGFASILVVTDIRGRNAYVAALQDGQFWAMEPPKDAGMGAKARNRWAAKDLANRFRIWCDSIARMAEPEPHDSWEE